MNIVCCVMDIIRNYCMRVTTYTYSNIKTHNGELRGQAVRDGRVTYLQVCSTTLKLVNALP